MNPSSGTVGPTPQEQALTQIAQQSFDEYRSKYLPMQDHLSDVITSMGQTNSWQRQEAEGKGNEDAASEFAQASKARTTAELDRGINVGSSRFKMGVGGMATAEAQAKGVGVEEGNQAIDKAYLGGLTAIARAGQGVAGTAVGGASLAGQVASREAISQAQEDNASRADTLGGIGFAVGAVGQSIAGAPPSPFGTTQTGAQQMSFVGDMPMAQPGGINVDTSALTANPGIDFGGR